MATPGHTHNEALSASLADTLPDETPFIRGRQTLAGPGEGVGKPLVLSSSYVTRPFTDTPRHDCLDGDGPHFYTRWSNPTVRELETRLAELEGTEDGLCFASGMGALSAIFLTFLRPGDRVVVAQPCYAGLNLLLQDFIQPMGIEVVRVAADDLDALEAAIQPGTRLVHVETPANPMIGLVDLAAVSAMCRTVGAMLCVDSTFATPALSRPVNFGADLIIHSLTKYICGHGDTIGGVVLGSRARMIDLRRRGLASLGACLDPMAAWRIARGVETLNLRMRQHSETAMALAGWLEGRAGIARVLYPGLTSHPQHDLARRQMAQFSGMIAFAHEGGREAALGVAERLTRIDHAISLGKTKSLIFYISPEDLQAVWGGLPQVRDSSLEPFFRLGLYRFSVGLESESDLRADLDQALG